MNSCGSWDWSNKPLRRRLWGTTWSLAGALALACGDGNAPFKEFHNTYAYTIAYSDSGPRTLTGSFGGFFSYLGGAANGASTAVYLIGDSLQVTAVLPGGASCPVSGIVPVGTTLIADSATVIVRHKRIHGLVLNPLISSFTIDSAGGGEAWGRFTIGVHPAVPEFAGPSAVVSGSFRLVEIEAGHPLHC